MKNFNKKIAILPNSKFQAKASVDGRSTEGVTPLCAALEYNQEDMGALLLEQKADVNASDNTQNSILHVAAMNASSDAVLMVLKAGASPDALNDNGETPLEVAKNPDTCRIILEFHTGYEYDEMEGDEEDERDDGLPSCCSPFKELPPGPASYLFWTGWSI